MNVASILLSIQSLLATPNGDSNAVPDVASVFKSDKAAFDATAREWTRIHAHGPGGGAAAAAGGAGGGASAPAAAAGGDASAAAAPK